MMQISKRKLKYHSTNENECYDYLEYNASGVNFVKMLDTFEDSFHCSSNIVKYSVERNYANICIEFVDTHFNSNIDKIVYTATVLYKVFDEKFFCLNSEINFDNFNSVHGSLDGTNNFEVISNYSKIVEVKKNIHFANWVDTYDDFINTIQLSKKILCYGCFIQDKDVEGGCSCLVRARVDVKTLDVFEHIQMADSEEKFQKVFECEAERIAGLLFSEEVSEQSLEIDEFSQENISINDFVKNYPEKEYEVKEVRENMEKQMSMFTKENWNAKTADVKTLVNINLGENPEIEYREYFDDDPEGAALSLRYPISRKPALYNFLEALKNIMIGKCEDGSVKGYQNISFKQQVRISKIVNEISAIKGYRLTPESRMVKEESLKKLVREYNARIRDRFNKNKFNSNIKINKCKNMQAKGKMNDYLFKIDGDCIAFTNLLGHITYTH